VDVIEIRPEEPHDTSSIRRVHREAFDSDQDANIVDALRTSDGTSPSLVAIENAEVIGHILYSSASIGTLAGAALGPAAVRPAWQLRARRRRVLTSRTDIAPGARAFAAY
jgi:putative acetyltransferase